MTWDELADAVLTHDVDRERAAWRDLTCVTCGDPVVPGEHTCAEHFIAAAHRRSDQERAA